MTPFAFRQEMPEEPKITPAANDEVFKVEYKDNNPVTDEEFKNFTRSGVVTEERILSLYYKMKNHASFSSRELAMYPIVSKKIEEMLAKALELEGK